jgi:Ca2+-binding RTX toxin-like protein
VEDLLRFPVAVPGIPAGVIPTGLSPLRTVTAPATATTRRAAAVESRNAITNLDNTSNFAQGFDRSNDIINGRGGNDFLSGLGGDDILRGNDGDDTLLGNGGRNRLVGGKGADTFVLAKNSTVRIVDFEAIEGDRLFLYKGLSFDQLDIQQGTGDQAEHTLIQANDRLLAIVVGTLANQITPSSFLV